MKKFHAKFSFPWQWSWLGNVNPGAMFGAQVLAALGMYEAGVLEFYLTRLSSTTAAQLRSVFTVE
jgi:hypothetical protein